MFTTPNKHNRVPWNKGKTGVQVPWNKGKKGVQTAWNKGLKGRYRHTPERKRKISLALSGRPVSPETRAKLRSRFLGRKLTTQQRKHLSEIRTGRPAWNKGIPFSAEVRARMSIGSLGKNKGASHWNWKGGATPLNRAIRESWEYKLWRKAVFARDDYRCFDCGQRGGNIEADHIYPFALFPRLRFAVENGRTLCRECHQSTDTFGRRCYTKFKIPSPALVTAATK